MTLLAVGRLWAAAPPTSGAVATVEALVAFGPRTPGSEAVAAARNYLQSAYQRAGYATTVQTFEYQQFQWLSSSLTVGDLKLRGNAMLGSPLGQVRGNWMVVDGHRAVDFAPAEGAIAIVRRRDGEITTQAQRAMAAGAIGLVVINAEAGQWSRPLQSPISIPVLALSAEQGQRLLQGQLSGMAQLDIQPIWHPQQGHNLVAHTDKAVLPRLVVGAHYDTVPGSVGANDNATGTAVVLELARRLAHHPAAAWIWFVAFDAEESGALGSQALLAAMPHFFKPRGMVNFEMLGLNETLLGFGTPALTAAAVEAVPDLSLVEDLGLSDHYPFRERDIPVLVITRGLHPDKDTPRDTEIAPEQLESAVDAAMAAVTAVAETVILENAP